MIQSKKISQTFHDILGNPERTRQNDKLWMHENI